MPSGVGRPVCSWGPCSQHRAHGAETSEECTTPLKGKSPKMPLAKMKPNAHLKMDTLGHLWTPILGMFCLYKDTESELEIQTHTSI